MNTAKLSDLRDKHEALRAAYRALSERSRDAQTDLIRLLNLSSGTPEQKIMQGRIFALADLSSVPDAALKVAGIDARYLRKIIDAKTRADKLRADTEALAPELRKSSELIARLNEYAKTA